MDGLINIGIFLLLLALGYFFGRRAESKHYRSIIEREDKLRHVLVLAERMPPAELLQHHPRMVTGNVVISVDYFKTVVASLRNLVGGNVNTYETLLDRARREALLRLQQQALDLGAEAVINVKFETSRISGNAAKAIGSIEVLAYGTAMMRRT